MAWVYNWLHSEVISAKTLSYELWNPMKNSRPVDLNSYIVFFDLIPTDLVS